MAKFKIGDRVMLVKDMHTYHFFGYHKPFAKIGEIFTIRHVGTTKEDDEIIYDVVGGWYKSANWLYMEECFKLVEAKVLIEGEEYV